MQAEKESPQCSMGMKAIKLRHVEKPVSIGTAWHIVQSVGLGSESPRFRPLLCYRSLWCDLKLAYTLNLAYITEQLWG